MKEENMNENIKLLIEKSLRDAGIKPGDIILVHSDSTAVKEITGLKWGDALNLLKESFLNVIGAKGTLIVPTFNWDFCDSGVYVHEKTMSQTGMFSNNILFDNRSERSFHPIYSFAGIGPSAKDIFSDISKSSFGLNSVFHKLHKLNAKVVFFNVSFEECTFVHYAEQSVGVDYRFLKDFKGKVSVNGQEFEDSFDFYARYLDRDINTYFYRLSEFLLLEKKLNKVVLENKYPVLLTSCSDIYVAVEENLRQNPYFLIKNLPAKNKE
jgi:aminoglycoside 3-N-acetyltransferase